MTPSTPQSAVAALHRTPLGGLSLVVAMTGVATALALYVDIAGAVVASGAFVVDSHVKPIKIRAVGAVAALNVAEGDRVNAGDVLIRLDDVQAQANLAIVATKLDELSARKSRLVAERDGEKQVVYPATLSARAANPEIAALVAGETRLFESRLKAREGQKSQLRERIAQLAQEAEGLTIQQKADEAEIAICERELAGVRELWSRRLVPMQRLSTLERDAARLKGHRGQIIASIAENNSKAAEAKLKVLQVDQDAASDIARELREIEAQASETQEKKAAAENDLRNLEIRSPQYGVVHELAVHAVGAVVAPGEPVMQIVPVADALRVEARVAPQDIDQVREGQPASLRVTGLNRRVTPELNGFVERVAPELSQDKRADSNYYSVRLSIPPAEFARLEGAKIVAGMPVETFMRTSSRSMMSYLVKPLMEQVERAFRER